MIIEDDRDRFPVGFGRDWLSTNLETDRYRRRIERHKKRETDRYKNRERERETWRCVSRGEKCHRVVRCCEYLVLFQSSNKIEVGAESRLRGR